MTSLKYKWAIGAFMLASLTYSCKDDVLDIKPTDFVSDAAVFSDINLTSQFVTNIYSSLLSGFERRDAGLGQDWSVGFGLLDMATDDIEGHASLNVNSIQNGDLNPSNFNFSIEMWQANYIVIRKANTLLARIDAVPTTDSNLKARLKAEGKFLRAFAYQELIKAFGGVPLITTEQKVSDDLFVPRSSFEECVNFIVKECDEAAVDLPPGYSDIELGHATKGAALALKARVLLYYASPLHNPGNDTGRWKRAADAAKDVMNLNVYELYPNYYRLFLDKAGNKEVIFAKKYGRPGRTHETAWKLGMSIQAPAVIGGVWGAFHATQNLVDSYEMKNGMLISEPGSGYEPQNPYANRDSRLDQSLLRNGSQWKGVTVETFEGGNANMASNGDRTKTGYGLKKMMDEKYVTADQVYQGGDNDWLFMRYAEVLLNYAEAQNEFSPAHSTAFDALNEVRRRAGQPALQGLSQAQLRERIRNERRVELSFEEHRFFDVRRWKQGSIYFNQPVKRMKIVKNSNGTFTYTVENLENRIYKENFNLLPIPQIERERNPKLEQNDY
ncbi:RagB/SusD family nutrient uptake outer membrane protein [Desertivirga arenae]|uniref:RagB/SusD family nutrient uptake outer membrane protein n=1 Tax=Desertivirga arenae TaxID=2810309 RepID=UPI001A970268|nr:RagB/SusD family nutrient uptake outer membrane protein [Pedobacter sp. SYSU D00823]